MEKMIKSLKPMTKRKSGKLEREKKVLLGLIDFYLQTGEPVGSETLRQHSFPDLSSATLRNYFVHLEEKGFLTQQHASGGRFPTDLAYQVYADEYALESTVSAADQKAIDELQMANRPEVALYLQKMADLASKLTRTAVILSAPKFDQDYIADVKLVVLDVRKIVSVIVTNFGVVRTDVFHLDRTINQAFVASVEEYFRARMGNQPFSHTFSPEDFAWAKELYNELLMRYIVDYTNFSDEEIYRTGFSQLLSYKEFSDINAFSSALALFEKVGALRRLLRETQQGEKLSFWIGDQLKNYCEPAVNCALLSIEYRIHDKVVGAIGLIGPKRLPYRRLFGVLKAISHSISKTLTACLYKYKISYRQAEPVNLQLDHRPKLLNQEPCSIE
ncbi:MAG: hrcA [Chlamydiales bacterium]|jgi:heat-inducible transcriptional repressor|nr:hrcA [Chlamydiales bacterium]